MDIIRRAFERDVLLILLLVSQMGWSCEALKSYRLMHPDDKDAPPLWFFIIFLFGMAFCAGMVIAAILLFGTTH